MEAGPKVRMTLTELKFRSKNRFDERRAWLGPECQRLSAPTALGIWVQMCDRLLLKSRVGEGNTQRT